MKGLFGRLNLDIEDEAELFRAGTNRAGSDASRQLITVVLCTAVVAVGAFLVMMIVQHNSPQGLDNDELIDWDGKTYERIDDPADTAALGITAPLTSEECGQFLTTLETPKALKGATVYQPKSNNSSFLLLLDQKGGYSLFRFCYFDTPAEHTGQDILEVCGSNTEMKAIDCYGVDRAAGDPGDWENSIVDPPSLERFQQLFGSLTPKEDMSGVQNEIDQSGTWDEIVTVRYKNGVTFNLCIYKKLRIMAGFRCVYDLPDELTELVSNI